MPQSVPTFQLHETVEWGVQLLDFLNLSMVMGIRTCHPTISHFGIRIMLS